MSVLVYTESWDGNFRKSSFEAVSYASETAKLLGTEVIEAVGVEELTTSVTFEKPAEKGACQLIDVDNVSELVSLLHNEAKVI